MLGDTAEPFAVVESDPGNLPMRQRSVRQSERGIGPGFRLE